MKKKIITVLFSLVLVITMIPQCAFGIDQANEGQNAESNSSEAEPNAMEYLNFTAQGGEMTIGLGKEKWGAAPETVTLEYSTNKSDWGELVSGQDEVKIPNGQTMYFRLKKGSPFTGQNSSQYWFFTMAGNGNIVAGGDVMSLVDPTLSSTTVPQDYAFTYLFKKCDKMIQAPNLSATTLKKGCYAYMFAYCDGLKTAPKLPATKMLDNCYESMFTSCTHLVNPPELPASTLAYRCYYCMFDGCSELKNPPALRGTTLAEECYYRTFYNCTKLEKPPVLNATNLAKGCYTLMFENCTNLKTTPKLPATTLKESCYTGMFRGCKAITKAPELPAKILQKNCYNNMFHDCTSLVEAPMLIATELADNCYFAMFAGCKSLKNISVKFSVWRDETYCTTDWVLGVNEKGVFTCPANLDTIMRDDSHVPQGWRIENYPAPYVPPVTGLHVKATNSKTCELTWNPISGENVTYLIYRGTQPTGDWGGPIATVSSTSYKDTKVISGNKYYYLVRACIYKDGVKGYGDYSNMDYGYPRINPVTGFRVWASDYQTTNLSWNKGLDNDAEFWIYRGNQPTGQWGDKIAVVKDGKTTFTQKVDPNKKYYYMVREAVKGYDGKYYFGPYTSVDYAYPRLTAPTGFSAWASNKTTCNCSWNKLPGDGIQYMVYRGTKPSGDWGSAIATVSSNMYTDTGRTTGTKYYYMVRAKVTVGGKTYFGPYTNMDYAYPR